MPIALEQPNLAPFVAPITIEHYHRMIDSGIFDDWPVELIDGVLFAKMSKSELHVFVVNSILRALTAHCSQDSVVIGKEDPITIGDSEPEPDISVVKGQLQDFRHAKPTTAELVIEVAISSLALDRAKAAVYASAGISEYWIVRPAEGLTEVYRGIEAGRYVEQETIAAAEVVKSASVPGFCLRLAELLA